MPELPSLAATDAREAPDLSFVFIARNEEKLIERCLESTLQSAESAVQKGRIRSYESILVDSASTDRTVELASRYVDKVIRLRPDWFLSPAEKISSDFGKAQSATLFEFCRPGSRWPISSVRNGMNG